jgi:hypothetical protein
MTDAFAYAKANARPDCPKCKGAGMYLYDGFHGKICEACCRHDLGWWQLHQHYGADNGKWCCSAGCGHKVDTPPANEQRN